MEVKLKVGLIDDEVAALEILSEIIKQIPEYVVEFSTQDPWEGLKKIENREADILITDVMIPDMGGLEISERLKESGIPIIFCSGNDRFAVSGYQLDAVYFILKPVFHKEVAIGLEKAKARLKGPGSNYGSLDKNFRIVNSNGGLTGELIKVSDIDYLEQSGNYTKIFMGKSCKVIVSTLTNTLQNLESTSIYRVHKSFAIDISKVRKFKFSEIILYNQTVIPIGGLYREQIKKLFKNKFL